MTYKHVLCSLQVSPSVSCTEKLSTELGAICARVLIVSNGCPTMTCAAPPTLPARSSFIVACVVDFIFKLEELAWENIHNTGSHHDYSQSHDSEVEMSNLAFYDWLCMFNY